ncbi:MAG TPA: helix-turn-helix transcriptional regulator [Candidatus Saccharimonadales bacterium]|nr:helix-turn-helix transcriptional regulator [Candidatus Saccharimonadales bacterium]
MGKSNDEPYKALGAKIKHLREQWHQSLEEVSGTLEIDRAILKEIESGKSLPADDILNMLINHFLLTDEQADELRQLAMIQQEPATDTLLGGIEDMIMKQVVMYLPNDNKVVYTDSMNAIVNKHGVTLQFMQNSPANSQQVTVSQVGMSKEHAKKVVEVLSKTLADHDRSQQTKLLPDKTNETKKSNKK